MPRTGPLAAAFAAQVAFLVHNRMSRNSIIELAERVEMRASPARLNGDDAGVHDDAGLWLRLDGVVPVGLEDEEVRDAVATATECDDVLVFPGQQRPPAGRVSETRRRWVAVFPTRTALDGAQGKYVQLGNQQATLSRARLYSAASEVTGVKAAAAQRLLELAPNFGAEQRGEAAHQQHRSSHARTNHHGDPLRAVGFGIAARQAASRVSASSARPAHTPSPGEGFPRVVALYPDRAPRRTRGLHARAARPTCPRRRPSLAPAAGRERGLGGGGAALWCGTAADGVCDARGTTSGPRENGARTPQGSPRSSQAGTGWPGAGEVRRAMAPGEYGARQTSRW